MEASPSLPRCPGSYHPGILEFPHSSPIIVTAKTLLPYPHYFPSLEQPCILPVLSFSIVMSSTFHSSPLHHLPQLFQLLVLFLFPSYQSSTLIFGTTASTLMTHSPPHSQGLKEAFWTIKSSLLHLQATIYLRSLKTFPSKPSHTITRQKNRLSTPRQPYGLPQVKAGEMKVLPMSGYCNDNEIG